MQVQQLAGHAAPIGGRCRAYRAARGCTAGWTLCAELESTDSRDAKPSAEEIERHCRQPCNVAKRIFAACCSGRMTDVTAGPQLRSCGTSGPGAGGARATAARYAGKLETVFQRRRDRETVSDIVADDAARGGAGRHRPPTRRGVSGPRAKRCNFAVPPRRDSRSDRYGAKHGYNLQVEVLRALRLRCCTRL